MSIVPRQALLARPPGQGQLPSVWAYLGDLFKTLFHTLATHADGINNVASRGVSQPVPLTSYTVAGAPAAASHTGALIFVSNEAGGAVPAFSDGTNWRRVTDRTVIS